MATEDLNRLMDEAKEAFARRLGEPKALSYVRSPGSLNIMGDHTGYYGGRCLAVAVSLDIVFAFQANDRDEVRVYSVYYDQDASFGLKECAAPRAEWATYLQGAATKLKEKGIELMGFDAVIGGALPIGACLGSSSALVAATALAFLALSGKKIEQLELAQLCHDVEVDFLGLHSELSDPIVTLLGERGMALSIDCRSLVIDYVPLAPSDAVLLICDTTIRSDAIHAELLKRREECREGVRQLAKHVRSREVKELEDVSLREFNLYGPMLPLPIRQRLKHVVTESERVRECAASLLKRNVVRAGVLMDVSHASLRDDFEVSCKELDALTEIAWNTRRVYGARMTGAGLGGAVVSLVEPEGVRTLCETFGREYKARIGITPSIYVCQAAKGAELLQNTE